MNYIDCAEDIRRYHDNDVKLPGEIRKKLREHRNANRDRLKENLSESEKPSPLRFQKQGSYAMRTTVQHPANDYDIDDGVVFAKADLKGERGGEMTPLDARKMVGAALEDDRFSRQPEVLKNCVRVYYNEGHHVDVPVYRESGDEGSEVCEIASSIWRQSDPAEVNAWFDGRVAARKSEQDDADDPQLRRLVRLLKRYTTSRDSWNLPNGFILTVLADGAYFTFDTREDRAFYNLIVSVRNRLRTDLIVKNPTQDEVLTKEYPDAKMVDLREKLSDAITTLQVLFDPKVTRKEALKAWAKVFNTDAFDEEIDADEESARASVVVGSSTPQAAVHKAGGGRFG
jgi:hypothetical protein